MQATRQTAWCHQGMLSGKLLYSREAEYKPERLICDKTKSRYQELIGEPDWLELKKAYVMDRNGLVRITPVFLEFLM